LRAGEGDDVERFGHGAQDRGNFLGHCLTDRRFVRALVKPFASQLGADAGSGARAKVGQDQPILDLVQLRIVQPGLGNDPGQVFCEFFRSLAKAAEQAVRPAGAASFVRAHAR